MPSDRKIEEQVQDEETIGVEELLRDARRRLRRITPATAWERLAEGAIVIDIRSGEQRTRDGLIPGAEFVPRNVLEWRLDPSSPHRSERLARRDRCVIVICDEGFQSSLAAATLRRMGLDATDVIGGFRRWVADGLPIGRNGG